MKKHLFLSLLCLSCANVTVSNSCFERLRELKINSITQQTPPDSEEQCVQAWNAAIDACKEEQKEQAEKDEARQQSLKKLKRDVNFATGFAITAFVAAIVLP